jgi:hypothetical protein
MPSGMPTPRRMHSASARANSVATLMRYAATRISAREAGNPVLDLRHQIVVGRVRADGDRALRRRARDMSGVLG